MQEKAPNIAKLFPDLSWDSDFRKAMACYLSELKAEKGAAAVESYITQIEQFSTRTFTSLTDIIDTPSGFEKTAKMLEVSKKCGMLEVSQRRMEESGYNKIFSDPELMKEFSSLYSEE